ncbi:hypothetical protein AVEN_218230-1 [Araneus ventricosus]|uniref:Uncharacterized protein n=1 Tax=Araneus ventricosus TaxID=182803 RepID=A0A4Y2QZ09_ARAVE|nr:hypothetical protein AVEN_218230-1 [Araneus ventricosus]
MYDLMCNGPTYMADLHLNRVLNMEPSDPEAETLPPEAVRVGTCGLMFIVDLTKIPLLVVKSRFRGQKAPGSKHYSNEDPPCIWVRCTLNHA